MRAEMKAEILKELKAPPQAPVKKREHLPTTCSAGHFVVTFSDGVQNMWTRENVYTMDQALSVARERAKLRAYPIVFLRWDQPINEKNVGFKNAVCIAEEFSASLGGQGNSKNPITSLAQWEDHFSGTMPKNMFWSGVKI